MRLKERMLNTLTSLFIFFSCTAYQQGKMFGDTQLLVFKVGVPILWIVSLCMEPKRSIQNVWFNALIALGFITTLILPTQPRLVAIEPLIYIFLAAILYYTLSNYLTDCKPIIRGICWAVVAQAVIVLLQGLGLDPICMNDDKTGRNTHFVGLYGYKYVFGAWMAIATPILIFSKRWFFGILSAVMCILSMSIAPIGLMFTSLVVGFTLVNKKYLVPAIVGILVIGSIAWFGILNKPSNQTLYHKAELRLIIESKFLPIMFEKPLSGWGLGSFQYIGPQVWNSPEGRGTYGTVTDGWNDYLQYGVECGIGFIVIFLGLIWNTLKNRGKSIGSYCSLLIVPFGCLFHNYLGHASLNVLMISLLSVFSIENGVKKWVY